MGDNPAMKLTGKLKQKRRKQEAERLRAIPAARRRVGVPYSGVSGMELAIASAGLFNARMGEFRSQARAQDAEHRQDSETGG